MMLWNRFCLVVVSAMAHGRAIPLLAERAFPCDELLSWFHGRSRWSYVMRLRGDIVGRQGDPRHHITSGIVKCASCTCAAVNAGASLVCASGSMAARA